jgi:hypothetical protein
MAEAIFAGEQVKEFPRQDVPCLPALLYTIFMWLTKDLFVSDGPRNTCNGQRQYQQPE